jgi:hypothetical protein
MGEQHSLAVQGDEQVASMEVVSEVQRVLGSRQMFCNAADGYGKEQASWEEQVEVAWQDFLVQISSKIVIARSSLLTQEMGVCGRPVLITLSSF